jgi:hypothetical protein
MELKQLTDNFNKRYKASSDKATLLQREIEVHELLFDDKKLPLNPLVSSNFRPLKDKGLIYTDGDIIRIREAYIRYIVNGADINESGELYKKKGLPPSDIQLHYYNQATMRFEYLKFLKQVADKTSKNPNSKYTVKGIILAYYYMRKKGIFPIPELSVYPPLNLRVIKEKLSEKYGLSYNSFNNDWNPLNTKKEKRLSNPDNIEVAIKLIKTFDYHNINEAVELARQELNEAELKS